MPYARPVSILVPEGSKCCLHGSRLEGLREAITMFKPLKPAGCGGSQQLSALGFRVQGFKVQGLGS